jgi:pyridoxine 5-phosphate synthase
MTDGRSPVKLSVNVNKIATLRNSRGGRLQSVVEATRVVMAAGAPGITVHPRADARHITFADVREIAEELRPEKGRVELNIEGDPRVDLLALALELRPDQFTLVPVRPGEITSQAGWDPGTPAAGLQEAVRSLQAAGIRVSIFVDPDADAVRWAKSLASDRIELYTEPYARAFNAGKARDSFDKYAQMASLAHHLGLGVNAGHDLNLENLALFRQLPHLDEVSIGHALVSHALYVGLHRAVRDYLTAVAGSSGELLML